MIITISTPDKLYFEQLISFLTSMEINSPNQEVFTCLVNYPEDKINQLKKMFPKYNFENREIEMKDKRGISLILLRIELILEFFEKYKKSVSWIDTDVIVRDDLSKFIDVDSKSIKILYRGDKAPKKVRFNAGIFSIGYSNETHKFVRTWRKYLLKHLKWGHGQLALFEAYRTYSHKVKLIKMNKKFNDLGASDRECFLDNSVMWHCKLHHFKNKRFQKEFKHYLKIGLKKIEE